MEPIQFKNVHNKCINNEGTTYWISRSCAVTALVLIKIKDGPFKNKTKVLINQRGENVPDFKGCWNIPCGYLDWNESSKEACIREVFEETGYDVRGFNSDDQPFFVNSSPTSNRENVVLFHKFETEMTTAEYLAFEATRSTEHSEEGEVTAIEFIFPEDRKDYEFAFGHEKYIEEYVPFYFKPSLAQNIFKWTMFIGVMFCFAMFFITANSPNRTTPLVYGCVAAFLYFLLQYVYPVIDIIIQNAKFKLN